MARQQRWQRRWPGSGDGPAAAMARQRRWPGSGNGPAAAMAL
jgi:hypothetical protein